MSKSTGSKNGQRVGARRFDRADFEAVTSANSHTVSEVIEMLKKGLIREDDYVFTMDGVKAIAHDTYKGGWNNCREQENPKTDWSRQVRNTDARTMINEAFIT
jgi:hypothetical protein